MKRIVTGIMILSAFAMLSSCHLDNEEIIQTLETDNEAESKTGYYPTACKTNCTYSCQYLAKAEIDNKRKANSFLGDPTSDYYVLKECGVFRRYAGGYIYNHPDAGVHMVYGAIFTKWGEYGWENGFLGYPTTDELNTSNFSGRFNAFQGGYIFWSPSSGAHAIYGAIYSKWNGMGNVASILGYPVTDEYGCPDGRGRYNFFQNGCIYWTSSTGAHYVRGDIMNRWGQIGWERSWLGFPITDEGLYESVRYNKFEYGYIFSNPEFGTREAALWFAGRYIYLPYTELVNDINLMIVSNDNARSKKTVEEFRTLVLNVGLNEVKTGYCGAEAKSRYGAKPDAKWCSEFARYVYLESGIYSDYFQAWNMLRKVTTVDKFRDFFRDYGQWLVTSKGQVNGNTIYPGDYLALTGSAGEKSHSAIAVAVSPTLGWVCTVEGNQEGGCTAYKFRPYIVNGSVHEDIDAIGKIKDWRK
ncbi:MAG: hypothetical protein JW881_04350 [Spirochaetales bacterium]|nr:hypothetical protein [Spirochaetales bacterium]